MKYKEAVKNVVFISLGYFLNKAYVEMLVEIPILVLFFKFYV